MKKYFSTFYLLFPLLLTGIFVFFSCQNNPSNPADEKTISGVIVDEQNNPVPFVIVDVYSTTTAISSEFAKDTTDEDGNYLLANLPGDISKMMVRITHQDFKTYEDNLSNFKSKSKSPILLYHDDTCKGAISLFTFNDRDSTALSDVEVRLFRSGTLIRKAFTKDGKLTFTNVCPGMYLMRLFKPGFRLIYDSTYVQGDDSIPVPLNYFLTETDTCCHGLIGVTVKDSATGNNIEGAYLVLWSNSMQIGSTKTDNNGYAEFKDVCEGVYTVKITKDGYNFKYVNNLQMACNDTNISTQNLVKHTSSDTCCTAVLITKVVDAKDSSNIEGATVIIFRSGAQFAKGITDNNGIFTATGLCAPATYTVKAYKDGYNYQYLQLIYVLCDTATMKIPIMKNSDKDSCCHGVVDVTVKDSANGNVLSGTSVSLFLGSTKVGIGNTDDNGFISFSKICPGDYTLRMQKDNYNLKYVTIHMDCNDTNVSTQYLSKKAGSDTCCTAVINVTVLDSTDNTPIDSATVYIFKSGGQTIQGTTDANGNFTASNLCAPASYTVKVTKSGYTFQYLPVSFIKCDTKNVVIKILKK